MNCCPFPYRADASDFALYTDTAAVAVVEAAGAAAEEASASGEAASASGEEALAAQQEGTAAAAEVDPASLNAQIRLFYFRTGLMQKMAQARMKPSEFETRIVAARQRATERMAKGEGVAEQAACEAEGPPLLPPASH